MNMKTFLRTTGTLAALLYALSLLLTWPSAGVFGGALNRFAGSSLFPATLGGGDIFFLGEFWTNSRSSLAMVPYTLLPLAALYLLLQILGNAGIMASFSRPEPDRVLPAFAGGLVRLGPRFLLLFLVMLPVYALSVFLFCLPALGISLAIWEGASEMAQIRLGILFAVLAACGLALGQVYHYSAKAALAGRGIRLGRALVQPWRLGWGYWRRMILRYVAVILGGGAAASLLTVAAARLPGAAPAILLLQLGVFLHVAARVALHGLFSAEMSRRLEREESARVTATPAAEPLPFSLLPGPPDGETVFPASSDILTPAEEIEVASPPPAEPFPGT
jgi:hypothetical protein